MTHHWTKPMSFRKKVFCNVCRKKIHSQGVLCEGRFVSCMNGEIIFFFFFCFFFCFFFVLFCFVLFCFVLFCFRACNNCQWQQLVGTVLHPETSEHCISNTYLSVLGWHQRTLNWFWSRPEWHWTTGTCSHIPPPSLPLFPSLSSFSIPLPLPFLYSPPSPLPLFPSLSPSSIPLPLPLLYSPPSPLPLFPSLSPSSISLPFLFPFLLLPPSLFHPLFQCASTMLIRSVETMLLMTASIVQHTTVEQV